MRTRAGPKPAPLSQPCSRASSTTATSSGCSSCCPRALLLLVFLTYPLGLGMWLGFTDAKIGPRGRSGSASTTSSSSGGDSGLAPLALQHALLHGRSRASSSSRSGLWLALLLNRNLPFKSFIRAIVLLPFIVPTVLSAIAFWWIYDAQFSIISWALMKLGLIDQLHRFPRRARGSRASRSSPPTSGAAFPFVAICLLAGLQTISPSLYEAAALDGATPWQRFRYVTLPLLTPIIAVVMTFSVLFTFTDFQLIYVHHARRPAQLRRT